MIEPQAFNSKTEGKGIKKLSPNETIALLLHHMNVDSKDGFYKTAEQYQKTLAPNGEFSWRLKRLLNEKPKQFTQLSQLSNDIKKLIVQKDVGEECVFLNDAIQSFVNELLIEWKNAEVFRYHNLGVRNKILLHGPTGNGKTTLARHIARLTELPFIEVNADMMIDSRLGNSGANIHMIFNQIKMPCVLFWDEVDTIGRARGKGNDSAAGMENERMVNSILVNIEKLSNDVIFIGATNRKEVLDTAFIRRFDCQLELGEPSDLEKEIFAKKLIEWFKLPFEEYDSSRFKNFSEIKLDLIDLARKYVLTEIQMRSSDWLPIRNTKFLTMEWIKTNEQLPPKGVIVETKIDDANGERNVQELKFVNPLWFVPDGSIYVYYYPTHWRHLGSQKK